MAEVLVVGKKISEMDLVTDIVGDEKIPTGVVGDKAVTTGQLLTYLDNNGKVQWGRIEGDIANQADLQNQFAQERDTLKSYTQEQVSQQQAALQEHIDATNEGFDYITTNGAALPYDESIEYVEGAPVLKDGVIQYKTPDGFKSRDTVEIPTYNNASDAVDPVTGVAEGAYFNIRSTDDETVAIEYQNIGGSAVATGKSYPSNQGVEEKVRTVQKPVDTIIDQSGKDQQELNDKMYRPGTGTPYFRTIFEFMPKHVIDDVFGDRILDHSPYIQAAIDGVGVGGVLWIPLTRYAQLNMAQTVTLNRSNNAIKIVGTRGTASRDSALATFKWVGATNGGGMFDMNRVFGACFEDCSFDGDDKATFLVKLTAERSGETAVPAHRHNFIRCGFGNAYNNLVQIGDGGNEDIVDVLFESCQFDYYRNFQENALAGIYIDAPQAYGITFQTCLFARRSHPNNFFHIRAGNVTINAATFDGNADSVDIFLDPYAGTLPPQLTVNSAETQSDWFLKTRNGAGVFNTKNTVLVNVRHRADHTGALNPKSIYWDLGHQGQLVMIGCNLQAVEVGSNAVSVIDVANTWGQTGADSSVTGFIGNTSVVTGLTGLNITEAYRTINGGLRVGDNFLSVCPSDANNNPSLFTGNKIDGDFWIDNKSDLSKLLPVFYRYNASGQKVYASDSPVVRTYNRTVVANADKFDYLLDTPVTPQIGGIYEVRWYVRASVTGTIYESGVMHVAVGAKSSAASLRKVDVSLMQETPAILTTGVAFFNPTTNTESSVLTASQANLNNYVIRLKFIGALDGSAVGDQLRVAVRRIGF